MRAELIHTSLPRGLDGGTGFVVAARTGGMPRALVDALSALSGLPEAWDGATDTERTMHCTRCIDWQGEPTWVASVIRPCGLDHTGRVNRIAHHRALEADECATASPMALLQDASRWRSGWSGAPCELDAPAALTTSASVGSGTGAWDRPFGEGVASTVLHAALRSGLGAWIVVPAGSDRLRLLAELVDSLPQVDRWSRGWSTRALRPGASGATAICVIDEREPALAAIGRAPWVIRASEVRASADRAARHVNPSQVPASVTVAGAPRDRITWSPASRLAVAGAGAEPVVPGAVAEMSVTNATDPGAESDAMSSVHVSMEPASRMRRRWLPWVLVAIASVAAVLWWRGRGVSP